MSFASSPCHLLSSDLSSTEQTIHPHADIVKRDLSSIGYFPSDVVLYCFAMATREVWKQITFGECVKQLRESRSITQNRLGMLANISPSNVAKIEKGERGVPEITTVASIADVLDLNGEERMTLFRACLWDRVIGELEGVAPYYLALMNNEQRHRQRWLVAAQNMPDDMFEMFAREIGNISGEQLRRAYKDMADSPRDADLRKNMLRDFINVICFDLQSNDLAIEWHGKDD